MIIAALSIIFLPNLKHLLDALAIVSDVATHINEDMKRVVSRDTYILRGTRRTD